MEAYSSDEEVAWGPVTLKECKAHIKRYRKCQRRHSTHCEIKGDRQLTKISNKKNMEPFEAVKEEDIPIPDISSYLTASLGNAKSDGDQHDSLLEYHSAVEKSSNLACESSVYYSGTDIEKSSNRNLKANNCNYKDISQINFVQKAMDRTCDYIFKTEHQTLIDNTSSPSKLVTEISENFTSESPIEISSDEGNATSGYHNLSYVEVSTEDEENKNSSDTNRLTPWQENIYNNTGTANYSGASAISVPEIDLQQFSESSDFPLDDTIEKINAILKQANMSMDDSFQSNDEIVESDKENMIGNYLTDMYKTSYNKNSKENNQSINLISGSFLQKYSPTVTPVKSDTNVKSSSTNKSNIPLYKKSPKSFRVPNVPPKLKSGQKTLKPNLKDIVSPVRMYINYSPKPIFKQNVHPVEHKITKTNGPSRTPEIKRSDNIDSLPTAVYKPSKHQILASEKNLRLPASIEKMVVKSNVIKSEKKYQPTNLFTNVSLDANSELTKTSFSDSQLTDSDPNVSVLYKASALRK